MVDGVVVPGPKVAPLEVPDQQHRVRRRWSALADGAGVGVPIADHAGLRRGWVSDTRSPTSRDLPAELVDGSYLLEACLSALAEVDPPS